MTYSSNYKIIATVNFFLRGNSERQKIYFRYRPNKNFDLVLVTPYFIEKKFWDSDNQCWNEDQIIKGARSSETRLLNTEIITSVYSDQLFKIH
ncbi:hypothetical protein SAMN05880574_101147 [Chryseobacterium sp. RU37D]|nr:hypothetical protein SAMN05880574_101147 [Chryseobacterium sp. RU37D]